MGVAPSVDPRRTLSSSHPRARRPSPALAVSSRRSCGFSHPVTTVGARARENTIPLAASPFAAAPRDAPFEPPSLVPPPPSPPPTARRRIKSSSVNPALAFARAPPRVDASRRLSPPGSPPRRRSRRAKQPDARISRRLHRVRSIETVPVAVFVALERERTRRTRRDATRSVRCGSKIPDQIARRRPSRALVLARRAVPVDARDDASRATPRGFFFRARRPPSSSDASSIASRLISSLCDSRRRPRPRDAHLVLLRRSHRRFRSRCRPRRVRGRVRRHPRAVVPIVIILVGPRATSSSSRRRRDAARRDKEAYIDRLGLVPHPEGGFFVETYRTGAAPMSSRGKTATDADADAADATTTTIDAPRPGTTGRGIT